MNSSMVKSFLKYGYSLGAKDFLLNSSTSRTLYNFTADRRYDTRSSNYRHTFWLLPAQTQHWYTNNRCPIQFNYCHFSTTPPKNGQTALKQKTANHNDKNKLVKEKKRPIVAENTETQVKTKPEIEHDANQTEEITQPEEKLSLTAKFKKMYKEYWYVLLPVHVVTSSCWIGVFYYLSTSGVDIPALLESMHFNETIISKLRDSSLGHAAVAYLCYKIATPLRYTVTLGGTTLSIKYLSQWGYIRPVPSKAKLKQMYDDQKAKLGIPKKE